MFGKLKNAVLVKNPLTRWRPVGVHGVLVEVGCVQLGADLGHDGRGQVAQAQALPVEAVEPPKVKE